MPLGLRSPQENVGGGATHHGPQSFRSRHGRPSPLICHSLPSAQIRHGLPSPLTHCGLPSPLTRHGSRSPRICHGSRNWRCPGGLLSTQPPSPLDGVWREDAPSRGGEISEFVSLCLVSTCFLCFRAHIWCSCPSIAN